MKKIIYILIFIIISLLSLATFVSSTYFFNKYIAKNIKEYGFNYKRVNGAIFKGFKVKDLTYKNKELSSIVELKIDPFKLFKGVISINKLYLLDVRKDILEDIVEDFKPKDDNSTSKIKIDLNFEFKNIYLTFKPFTIDNIKVKKAELRVSKIAYINYKFNVGNLVYKSQSDIADIFFKGQFKKRVLKIDRINVRKLDSKKVISLLKSLKSSENNKSSSEILNSPFTPKTIEVKNAYLNLLPFTFEDLSIKDLNLNLNNAKFDVENLLLKRGNLNFNYLSKELDIKLNSSYYDNNLTLNKIIVYMKQPNRIEKFINSLTLNSNKNSNSNLNIVPISSLKIDDAIIKINNYKYKKEKIKKVLLKLKKSSFNIDKKRVKSKKISISLISTLGNLNLKGSIDKNITINNITINSNNFDKIINYIPSSNSDSNSTLSLKLPNNYIIKKVDIKGKKLSFNPFKIDYGFIKGSNIKGDIKNIYLKSGKLKAYVKSPWGQATLNGKIENNNYYANGSYNVAQPLLDEYSLPLKAKSFERLNVNGRFGFTSLDINVSLKGKDILKNIKNIDILSSKNRLKYNYITSDVLWSIDANIDTPYISNAKLINTLSYIGKSDKLTYYGTLISKKELFSNKKLQKLFDNLKVNYKGDSNTLKANLLTSNLNGIFETDYTKAKIKIKNQKDIKLSEVVELPDNYKDTLISKILINSNLDFKQIFPLKGDIDIVSNLFNINGKWIYKDSLNLDFTTNIPKTSILLTKYKNLNYAGVKNFNSKLIANSKNVKLEFKNSNLSANLDYNIKDSSYKSLIKANAMNLNIEGVNKKIVAKVSSNKISRAINSIKKIYKLKLDDNIDGKLNSTIKINDFKETTFNITSPKIVYKKNKNSIEIENIVLNGKYFNNTLLIDNYKFLVNKYNIYANKSSKIEIKDNILDIKTLWVNDSLFVKGSYNIDKTIGRFKVKSNRFELDNTQAKVVIAIDANVNLIKNKKDISGTIKILGGKIKSILTRKNIADNEDIIIIQRKREKESTDFAKNVKLNLKILTTKALIYAQNGSYIKLLPNMSIKKRYNSLSNFKGVIKIAKGSYYTLNKKKLKVTKGLITFKGKSSSPYLNIELKYSGKEYTVYINVSGTPTRTVLYFRSNPPLTKEQILAYLLFDDSSAVGTHSKDAMLNMIGGSLAKSFLGSIGIKLDHITVKENGFSIGKNITKNITIYYNQNKEKPSIKTRIDITKSIHTDIEIGKDKQSADIIFSNEY